MITTDRDDYYQRLKLLRQHGMSVNDRDRHEAKKIVFEDHLEVGYNYRMTDIQAAIGIKQLEKLDWLIMERRKIAVAYFDAFKDLDCIQLPAAKDGYQSNYQSYIIYLKKNCPIKRNELMQKLLDNGIATRRGIMTSHRETAYKNDSIGVALPVSEDLQDNAIILPLYIPLHKKELKFIIDNFLSIVKNTHCQAVI
jgi:dTDP-4-amino-4,6-dideoxygalactose transaminase